MDAIRPHLNETEDPLALQLAVFYHDLIYNPRADDNELRSAEAAQMCLITVAIPAQTIARTHAHIMATESHEKTNSNDTNLFLDGDRRILSADWGIYWKYAEAIKKEYSFYPEYLYNDGRVKALRKFLRQDEIYFRSPFTSLESKARDNMKKEIELLLR